MVFVRTKEEWDRQPGSRFFYICYYHWEQKHCRTGRTCKSCLPFKNGENQGNDSESW